MRDTLKRIVESPWAVVLPIGVVVIVIAVLAWKASTMEAVHQKIDAIKTELRDSVKERDRMEKHLEFIDRKQAEMP